MIAKVIVNVSSSNTDQFFDYILPVEFENFAKIGSRVKVSFGDGNRQIMGYIMDLKENPTYDGHLKEIIEVVDYDPILTSEQIELAKFIKSDAVCPLIRILNLMIPDALRLKTKKYLTINNYNDVDANVVELFKDSETILYSQTLKKYDGRIAKEIKNGNIKLSYDLNQGTKEKQVLKYIINPTFTSRNIDALRSSKAKEFLLRLYNEIAKTSSELIDQYEVSLYMIENLAKKGFLNKIYEKSTRIKVRDIPVEKRIRTTSDNIVTTIIDKLKSYQKPLLYIPKDKSQELDMILQTVNYNQKLNKNTVIFVPEILSSYQIENQIRKHTGLTVALINSNLSVGEILDYYNEVKDDNYRVIVTTSKGALFPYKNVGSYIMLDSESDNYYNDQSPRYDLHKVIEFMASLNGASVIRVSSVPTVFEYTYALKGYLDIIEDFANNYKCKVEVIDQKKELKFGNNSSLSVKLIQMLQLTRAKNKKSLLIVNNRSYSSYVMCRTCGSIIKCPKCEISMQYNKKSNQLICPACSYRIPFSHECPNCNSKELKFGGVGIEQVEEDLKENLPNFKIATLVDNSFDNFCMIETEFEEGDTDILITTDLYSRSLLAKNIGLVGIVSLDSVAKMADYDATSRAYSMLIHSVDLIKDDQDSILAVQTYNLDDQFLKDFLTGDYHSFIKNEIVTRKILKNEPFYYVNRILVKGKYEEVFKVAYSIKEMLKDAYGKEVFVMGPVYNYQYQAVQIIIKHKIVDISNFYMNIYQKYQSTNLMIIIDKYPKYL